MTTRDRIYEQLEKAGLTIQGASLKAGLGQTTLRDYLINTERSVTMRTLGKLAVALGTSAEYLHTGASNQDGQLAEVVHLWSRIRPGDRNTLKALAESLARKE